MAAQNQVSYTVKRGMKIHGFTYTVTTTNASAGRLAFLDIEWSGGIIFRINLQIQVDASGPTVYRYSEQAAIAGVNQVQLAAPVFAGQDSIVNFEIASVAAGDQMTDIYMVVEYDE